MTGVADVRMIGRFGNAFAGLALDLRAHRSGLMRHRWHGHDLQRDVIVAEECACFGFPPAHVWGIRTSSCSVRIRQ